LKKLDDTTLDTDRLRDEKDQEIAILQEGMDATIKQLHESQQVRPLINMFDEAYPLQDQSFVDQATNAQIDTLILDNRKKLNQIIGA
jgi:huntingtin-interacting protein 1-related protein